MSLYEFGQVIGISVTVATLVELLFHPGFYCSAVRDWLTGR